MGMHKPINIDWVHDAASHQPPFLQGFWSVIKKIRLFVHRKKLNVIWFTASERLFNFSSPTFFANKLKCSLLRIRSSVMSEHYTTTHIIIALS